jgi:hypothetical protein
MKLRAYTSTAYNTDVPGVISFLGPVVKLMTTQVYLLDHATGAVRSIGGKVVSRA